MWVVTAFRPATAPRSHACPRPSCPVPLMRPRAMHSQVMGDSAYSFSLTTFSPSGKLVQIEYALNAVATGSTSLGVKAKNGVVVATEKKLPT